MFQKLTNAEQCLFVFSQASHLSEKFMVDTMGAVKIVEFEGPQVVCLHDDSSHEVSPGATGDTEDNDFICYQFPDGTLLWYIRTSGTHYVQLRGMYNGKFRHTRPMQAGGTIRDAKKIGYPEIWDMEIHHLEIPVRTENNLKAENIYYIGDVVNKPRNYFLKVPNMGRVSFGHLEEALQLKGLSFDTDVGPWCAPAIPF